MKTQAEREAGQSTDVLEQAINIVRHVEATGGRISLNLDLDQPGHRAALAAALTVLRAMGEDSRLLLAADGDTPIAEAPAPAPDTALDTGLDTDVDEADATKWMAGGDGERDDEGDAVLRRDFAAAVANLTTDTERQAAVVREAFPRIRDLLHDGVNVESVAQIQYRRWLEENLDTVRRN
ncbi:MAG: hypothetical protein M3442_07670 [Chloroflexota bacterium]|nr:hypothetical protein [Chloroflexota bacterium]